MPKYVKSMSAVGVYGRFNLRQNFEPGINILHGKNGAGKTTFLHILANVLNADYKRFAFFLFDEIVVELSDGQIIAIYRRVENDEPVIDVVHNGSLLTRFAVSEVVPPKRSERVIRDLQGRYVVGQRDRTKEVFDPLLPADYFPAFRTMIEAWALTQDEHEAVKYRADVDARPAKATRLAREVFGKFVPQITYPSPTDIDRGLSSEVQNAIIRVAISEQESMSQAFLDIFAALPNAGPISDSPEEILDEINALYKRLEESYVQSGSLMSPTGVYASLRSLIDSFTLTEKSERTVVRILNVYRNSLAKRVRIQETAFEIINRYLDAVNDFLDGKKLEIVLAQHATYGNPSVKIMFDDGTKSELQTLSSGERQIITLIYAATHMRKPEVVLIDEPEISLHVDWQRLLLKKMAEQLGDRQLIVCTHSPVIASDFGDKMKELRLSYTHKFPLFDFDDDISQEGEDNQ
jgi:energy-coupling factor transporter ATP-binding protein EcfA2